MISFAETSGRIIDGRIEFSVPLTKVDEEKRMVHGFATLDNVDLAGDVVDFDASLQAFQRFHGNIREMHDSHKAAGKLVSFRPERYYDAKTNKVYNGIFVSAYVSKGAQDTWEKVLDGTLTGYSIGGIISKTTDEIREDGIVRVVKSYDLVELSLVDSPCNQLASIISFEKNSEGGYLSKTVSENVFWCRKDNIVQITDADAASCYHCETHMQNIGFVESTDDQRMSVVKSLLAKAMNVPTVGDNVEFDEGYGVIEKVIPSGLVKFNGLEEQIEATESDPVAIVSIYVQKDDTMIAVNRRTLKNISSLTKTKEKEVENVNNAETDVTVVEEVIEKSVDESLGAPQVFDAEPTVEAEKEDEVKDEESAESAEEVAEPVEKSAEADEGIAEIQTMLKSLTEALAPLADLIKSLGAGIQENKEAIEKVVSDLDSAKSEIASANEEFGKRVEAVESKSAFQKSADLGEIRQVEPVVPAKTSKWAGRILDAAYFN